MDATVFRDRLRRMIYDEDTSIEMFTIKRAGGGFLEVSPTHIIGYDETDTQTFSLDFVTYNTYNALIYAIDSVVNYTVDKATSCVGSKTPSLFSFPKAELPESGKVVHANQYFSDSELDDLTIQAIFLWNDIFESPYTSIETFPEEKSVPLSWIAAVLCLEVRLAGDTVAFYDGNQSGKITSVSLGGELSISKENIRPDENSPTSYYQLIKRYSAKWNEYLKTAADASAFPEISEIEKKRVVRETGALPYLLDDGLNPIKIATAEVSGNDVVLTWSPIYNMQFSHYLIMRNGTEMYRSYDPHTVSYTDEGLGTGTYEYSIYAVNLNNIKSPVYTVSAEVV